MLFCKFGEGLGNGLEDLPVGLRFKCRINRLAQGMYKGVPFLSGRDDLQAVTGKIT